MKLIVDGYEFSERQSHILIAEVLKSKEVSNPEDVQQYLKSHTVEEMLDEIILRNKDFYGWHFAVRKYL
jgi:hypothetical protein